MIENNHGQSNYVQTNENNQFYGEHDGFTVINPTAGMTPEEIEAAGEVARQDTEQDIATSKGTMS